MQGRDAVGEELVQVGRLLGLVGEAALSRPTVAAGEVRAWGSLDRVDCAVEVDLEDAAPPRAEGELHLAAVVDDNVRVDCKSTAMLGAEKDSDGEKREHRRDRRGNEDVLALKAAPFLDRTTAPWSFHVPGSIDVLEATPIAEFWLPSDETE